ncbi:hypothetical protein AVEN_95277-1 [Araneus ventricosus]|uniref:DNA helicase Pif1-like 2B domain-containing protein n=1 Tax=Araneus ventricosus TaxID=182803 RepID=A0A4Y2DHN9_ARAVE|nr:hypothetical protein AVEN_95277-1 [Araneus ventricosus]
MRVHLNGDPSSEQFADNLFQLGNGAITPDNQDGCIAIQSIGRIVKTQQELKEAVLTNVAQHFIEYSWLCQRAILVPRNEDVSVMNKQLLLEFPGSVQVYKSIDTTCDINEAVNYPTEFLNTLGTPGVPSHTLELKIGKLIMHPDSLCNGRRLCVKKLMRSIIENIIVTGHAAGENVFIPRIPIIPSDFPFHFKRLQFPVRLSFAMSINKAQGRSLKVVGFDLLKPFFSHGQLYVVVQELEKPTICTFPLQTKEQRILCIPELCKETIQAKKDNTCAVNS